MSHYQTASIQFRSASHYGGQQGTACMTGTILFLDPRSHAGARIETSAAFAETVNAQLNRSSFAEENSQYAAPG